MGILSIKNALSKANWPVICIVSLAAILRLAFLELKPPHFDEGVNGWFVDQITKTGYFHYDPKNYHGPLHFYVLFIFQTLFGRHAWALRLPIAMASTLTVWLVTKFDRFLGGWTSNLAALAMAVSPAAVFYGRYAIHESWLVLFLILTVWGLFGLWSEGKRHYLVAVAAGVTGMILTKETYFIHIGCLVLAALCLFIFEYFSPAAPSLTRKQSLHTYTVHILATTFAVACFFILKTNLTGLFLAIFPFLKKLSWSHFSLVLYSVRFTTIALTALSFYVLEKILPSAVLEIHKQIWSIQDFLILLLLSLATIVFFYSGAFFAFGSLKGLCQTYAAWFQTGTEGHGHEKPFDYWLTLLLRYEWVALVGLGGSLRCLWPNTNRFVRYLSIYGAGAFLAYSIIHYKTPWCVISIIWPFFFVFGSLLDELRSKVSVRIAAGTAACFCIASLVLTIRLNFFHYTDEEEPYVYVQTLNDLNKLTRPLFALVARDPGNYHLAGNILLPSYHPLPWLLGDFPSIGYYDADRTPTAMDADFLVVDRSRIQEVELSLRQSYYTETFKLRASMDEGKLYFNAEKFRDVFPNRKPEFNPHP